MDDTPFVNDGADTSLRKAVSLLNKIEAKTGSAGGTVALDAASLNALENISVTFPSTQNVNVTNAGLNVSVTNLPATQPVSGTFWPTTQPVSGSVSVSNLPATQPVSIANPPVTPVTDNGGSLTVDGSLTATQATAASLKAQAQLLNAAGSVVDYAMTGTAGTPATDVVTVQGISGGTVIPVSLASVPSHAVTGPLTNTELRAAAVPVSGTFWPTTQPVSGSVSVSNLPATQPVSLASAPVTPVTDNGGSLTVDGTVTASVSNFGSIATDIGSNAPSLGIQLGFAAGEEDYRHVGPTNPLPIVGTVNTYPQQGTTVSNTNFTSTTASTALVSAVAGREVLTVFNQGPGNLFISAGSTCTTTSYQVRLSAGDYWECPAGQLSLAHTAVFATAGTARVTEVS